MKQTIEVTIQLTFDATENPNAGGIKEWREEIESGEFQKDLGEAAGVYKVIATVKDL